MNFIDLFKEPVFCLIDFFCDCFSGEELVNEHVAIPLHVNHFLSLFLR